jgi:hypothetical protein
MRLKRGRQLLIEPRPSQPAIIAARHGPGCAAVIDAPHGKDGFAIGHEQGRRMPLVEALRALRDDDLARSILRKIDDAQGISGRCISRKNERTKMVNET